MMEEKKLDFRCPWAHTTLEIAYHDNEWGRPCHDDRALFELLELEGFQAGLSWSLILERRAALRTAFDGFHPERVAAYGPEDLERLLEAPGVIRNRSKLHCAVGNARAFLKVQAERGSFDAYLWSWVEGVPVVNHWTDPSQLPAESGLSRGLSADLRRRGFKFVGPVICYSYLQAAGLVNDHLVSCPWHESCNI